MLYYDYYDSPVGRLLLECSDDALTGLWIAGQKYYAAGASADFHVTPNHPIFNKVRKWLAEYFNGKAPAPASIPLRPRGTDFQRKVWEILCSIPYGRTITYGDIAQLLNTSPRAVGGAVGRNPISIIIPCHRVIGSNNTLTGYAGGLNIKAKLLAMENIKL